jgi:drug/metabolite transporter (DMT)-like permease
LSIDVLTTLFIAVRIFANPISNVSQKQLTQRSAHPVFIITVVFGALAALCAVWWTTLGTIEVPPGVWTTMLIAAMLAVASNVLLVYALREADLSLLGPINAFKSVVSLVLGVLLIGERPTTAGVAGVLLIVAGSYFVIDKPASQPVGNAFVRFFSERGIQLRFAALFLSATEAIVLKRAIVASSPLAVFVLWSVLGLPIALTAAVAVLRKEFIAQVHLLRSSPGTYVFLAFTTGIMQLATVLTFRELQVGYSLALFQLSAIVSVVLGRRYFGEAHLRERLVGSAFMAAGAALIAIQGHR